MRLRWYARRRACIVERFATVDMNLCESLIWEVQKLIGKLGRTCVGYCGRISQRRPFQNHQKWSSAMSTGILGGGLVDLGWLRFCDCFDHILVTPIRSGGISARGRHLSHFRVPKGRGYLAHFNIRVWRRSSGTATIVATTSIVAATPGSLIHSFSCFSGRFLCFCGQMLLQKNRIPCVAAPQNIPEVTKNWDQANQEVDKDVPAHRREQPVLIAGNAHGGDDQYSRHGYLSSITKTVDRINVRIDACVEEGTYPGIRPTTLLKPNWKILGPNLLSSTYARCLTFFRMR